VFWFIVPIAVAGFFILSIALASLWVFCERDWIGVFGMCFGAAMLTAGFVCGGWWWLAAIVGATLVAATIFQHALAPALAASENHHDVE
jgi:hypothetical protein